VSSYDPDEPSQKGQQQTGQYQPSLQSPQQNQQYTQKGPAQPPPTLGSQRKFINAQKVSTISQNYNEKTMLLSSDDEYQ
jgi:hypothetical protein